MNTSTARRVARLTSIFFREQLREPISLLWTLISPSALFYLITFNNMTFSPHTADYIQSTAGFYAYISATVAFFGVTFYIIGRRESGFIRSFIYSTEAKSIFLASHLVCYFITASLYCVSFYLITKPGFGEYNLPELAEILYRFLTCFIIFCSPALLLANRRLKFQTANTVISIIIFTLVLLTLLSSRVESTAIDLVNIVNPFHLSKDVMAGQSRALPLMACFGAILVIIFACLVRTLKINPVWSRY